MITYIFTAYVTFNIKYIFINKANIIHKLLSFMNDKPDLLKIINEITYFNVYP